MTTANSNDVPLAIWPVAQTTAQYQRVGKYVKASSDHPGKMLPALARRIVEEYSKAGDLVVDPMAGIGTTIIEGAIAGRHCLGFDLEPRWVDIAHQNLAVILSNKAVLFGDIRVGDARQLSNSLGQHRGQVDLIATSPPYACEVAVIGKGGAGDRKRFKRQDTRNYSPNTSNLGHARGNDYRQQMRLVYQQCYEALRPGGLFVTVTKNMRRKNQLIDLAGITVELAQSVGFGYLQHNIALLCGLRDSGIVARPSYWQTTQQRRAHKRGIPQHLVAHEDVLVFVKGVANA